MLAFKPIEKLLNYHLIDIDECKLGIDECQSFTYCNNTIGSYRCSCKEGFRGNGIHCQGKQESMLEYLKQMIKNLKYF